jgi:inosine-uridine nucleoside N-ribohydrolase
MKQAPGPIRNVLNLRNQITPVAEFNTFADAVAAARVYALSSQNPASTMPPTPPAPQNDVCRIPHAEPYPAALSRKLRATLFTLDVTNYHTLSRGLFRKTVEPLLGAKSPLAEWAQAFLSATFNKIESLQDGISGDEVALQLHDPLCIWYCMTDPATWKISDEVDIRVETTGQWTRGLTLLDRRPRRRREPGDDGDRPGDTGNWLSTSSGNRLRYCIDSPDRNGFGRIMLERIFFP